MACFSGRSCDDHHIAEQVGGANGDEPFSPVSIATPLAAHPRCSPLSFGHMTYSYISWLLFILQLVLLASTGFLAPIKMQPRLGHYLCYTVGDAVAWLAYAIAAMLFDGRVGNDVPGGGYLFVGLLGWLVGSGIFLVRAKRRTR